MRYLAAVTTEMSEELQSELTQMTEQISRTQEYLDRYLPSVISFGLRLVLAVIAFLIGSRVIKILRKIVRRSMERAGAEITVRKFIKYLVNAVGYILLLLLILSVAGVQPTSFATIASSVTVALGLALQGSLTNFAGGLLILVLKPFKVGDYIIEDTNKNEGTVRSIGLVYTELVTMDNRVIVVPNGTLSNSSLTNVTSQEKRQLDLKVGISYESDLKKAKELLVRLIEENPMVLKEEEHFAYVSSLDDSAVTLGCRCWTRTGDYWRCKWDMTEAIKMVFDEEGIEIPYGQLDVHIKSQP